MCRFFEGSRNNDCDSARRLGKSEKDAELIEVIVSAWERSLHTYDYHRMWLWLKR